MFGGVGTIWGPVVGAVVLIPLAEILHAQLGARVPGIQGVVYGAAIILVIMRMPQGVVWAARDALLPHDVAESRAPPSPPTATRRCRWCPVRRCSTSATSRAALAASRRCATSPSPSAPARCSASSVPNGAGKTTLFNVMNGLVAPGRGEVRFGDVDLVGRKPSAICALGIGRTFQVTRPFLRMTVLENVIVGAFAKTASDAEAADKARLAIGRVGLGASRSRRRPTI